MKSICLLKAWFLIPSYRYFTPAVVDTNQKSYRHSYITKSFLSLLIVLSGFFSAISQSTNDAEKEAAYTRTINQRADKIVATLNINDAAKATRVRDIIANQYRALNDIHTKRDTEIKAVKARPGDKEAITAGTKALEDNATVAIEKQRKAYIESLSKELTPEQIEKVKDGMTYNVVPITYKGYQSMLPNLTAEQKEKILAWLIEAREHAMSAETSDKKHAWFGKYKGRINNYLSAAGYDLKKESEEWHKRLKAEEAAKKGQ